LATVPYHGNSALGITATGNLSPSTHIRNIVCKANSRAIAIRCCFISRDITLSTCLQYLC